MSWIDQLVVAPIVIPLLAGGVMLLLDRRQRRALAAINIGATLAVLAIAVTLLLTSMTEEPARAIRVYQLGNWPAQFGIVLVADKLAAVMLVLTATLACTALLYALAHWHRAGSYFHPLFQLLLMGLNGAFLTGDLFNLFVFFEVLLAASYGLALYGSGRARVSASLHYITINLVGSSLFLIGVSLIYGTAGTLNMAALGDHFQALDASNRRLLEIGAAIMGVAFLVKAAAWPIGFWLPPLYAAAIAPVAAIFAIMTKVGIYVILRLGAITWDAGAGASLFYGEGWLFAIGIVTIGFATIGMLATQDLPHLAGYSVLISSGTLLATLGIGGSGMTGAALFYLVSSTLAVSAFFLLVELIGRGRSLGDDVLAVTLELYGAEEEEEGVEEEVGIAIPVIVAVLGFGFLACALLLSGLPPLSGFIAKLGILSNMLMQHRFSGTGVLAYQTWIMLSAVLLSGLATVVALMRTGVRVFWTFEERVLPQARGIELAAIGILLFLCVVLTVQAGPVMRFMQSAGLELELGRPYIDTVVSPTRAQPSERVP